MTHPAVDPRIAEILRKRRENGTTIQRQQPSARTGTPEVITVSDGELTVLLRRILPRIDTLIQQAITSIRSDGKLSWPEALALAPEIRNIVSMVVSEWLPQIKGKNAYDLVSLVLAELVQQYVSPHLPAVLRPYLTARLIRSLIDGLQWAYDNWVRPRIGKPAL